MNNTGELYLILHKVRGEPAFDIAECIGEDEDGEIWIIPTSGHRAYPVRYWEFDNPDRREFTGDVEGFDYEWTDGGNNWSSWPDHYTISDKAEYGHQEVRKDAVRNLLELLGRGKPKLARRRV